MKLTKRTVEGIEPASGPVYAWDDQLAGFGVKVLPNGKRKYLAKYRVGGGRTGRARWLQLGAHGTITCEQARELATQALAAAARGEDPQGLRERLRRGSTVRDLWNRYETEHLPRKKASSAADDRQKARDHILPALGAFKVNDVARADIKKVHQSLAGRPYQGNRVLSLLSKMFNLAEGWGMRPEQSNPCRQVEKFKEQARTRYLNAEELRRLGQALREGEERGEIDRYMAGAIQLLLLTGARVSEVLSARWDWVAWDRRVIELPDSKTGAKPLFLSEAAVAVLRNLRDDEEHPFIIRGRFAGRPLVNLAKPWRRVCALAKLEGVRIHDLRHTAASIGVATGTSLPIIGRLLGHSQSQTTQRYAHVDLDPALLAADKIGDAITGALNPKG
ncbi:MAG: tyrosine-type recombinase/integrase [Beijerinckiaceae bacterium]